MPPINHPCLVCHNPTSKWCSRCEAAWYCTEDHLKAVRHDLRSYASCIDKYQSPKDWPRHRLECNARASPSAPSRANMIATPPPAEPQIITVQGIYFNPQEGAALPQFIDIFRPHQNSPTERPTPIKVICQPPPHPKAQGACPSPDISQYFPNGVYEQIVLTQGLGGDPLRFPLQLFYCPTDIKAGLNPNRSIAHITSGAALRAWCGPVVVMKFNGSRKQAYTDAGGNDLPALSAYFLAYK